MRKVLLGALFLALIFAVPLPTMARSFINVSIGLPPPIAFAAPPELVVLPGSYVYVAPDLAEDIYFYNGWWWRPWGGHWYRSRAYDSGWVYYRNVPSFYRGIPPTWRNNYREHRWYGHPWEYQRIPHHQLHQNWRNWEQNRHWERQQNWGAPGFRPQQQLHQPSRNMQMQPNRPQHVQDVRSTQSLQHGNRDRGQAMQQGRRSGSPPPSQLQTPQHMQQGGAAAPQGRSHRQHGDPQSGQEEQQGRRGR